VLLNLPAVVNAQVSIVSAQSSTYTSLHGPDAGSNSPCRYTYGHSIDPLTTSYELSQPCPEYGLSRRAIVYTNLIPTPSSFKSTVSLRISVDKSGSAPGYFPISNDYRQSINFDLLSAQTFKLKVNLNNVINVNTPNLHGQTNRVEFYTSLHNREAFTYHNMQVKRVINKTGLATFEETVRVPPGPYILTMSVWTSTTAGSPDSNVGVATLDTDIDYDLSLDKGPIAIDYIDPNTELRDEYLQLRGIIPKTKTQAKLIRNILTAPASSLVSGFVADGVTPVIVRAELKQSVPSVKLSLRNEADQASPANGVLLPLTGGGSGSADITVPVQTVNVGGVNKHFAYAVVMAPLDFRRTAADDTEPNRILKVKVEAGSNSENSQLILSRPPVILLHGLWGSKDTWVLDMMSSSYFRVYPIDYSWANYKHIGCIIDFVSHEIEATLKDFRRSTLTAATQVDAVTHSMGGLITRLYGSGYGLDPNRCDGVCSASVPFLSEKNFFAGTLHKLITVNTPHRGSALAPHLVTSENKLNGFFGKVGKIITPRIGCSSDNSEKCITGGAVFDLRPDSPAIAWLGKNTSFNFKVPAHAFVGNGGAAIINKDGEELEEYLRPLDDRPSVRKTIKALKFLAEAADEKYADLGPDHDLIVSKDSQMGGLTGAAMTEFDERNPYGVHVSATSDPSVSTKLIEVLNATVNSNTFAYFRKNPAPPTPEQTNLKSQVLTDSETTSVITVQGVSEGQVFQSNESTSFQLQFQAGFTPKTILVGTPSSSEFISPTTPTSAISGEFYAPSDQIGSIPFTAAAVDSNGNLAFAEPLNIFVKPASALLSVKLDKNTYYLSGDSNPVPLQVSGVFGFHPLNIDVKSFDVDFEFSEPSVAAVSSDGRLFPKRDGETTLKVSYENLIALALVKVSNCGSTDADKDGVFDNCDNCRLTPNADQSDVDQNGVGDACSVSCPAKPQANCSQLSAGGTSNLKIRRTAKASANLLNWNLLTRNGSPAALGNPVSGDTSYAVCIYDQSAGGESKLIIAENIFASDNCGSDRRNMNCWTKAGSRLRYQKRSVNPKRQLDLKVSSAAARSEIRLSAKGIGFAAFDADTLPLKQAPSVTAQLITSANSCWQADFASNSVNSANKFTAEVQR